MRVWVLFIDNVHIANPFFEVRDLILSILYSINPVMSSFSPRNFYPGKISHAFFQVNYETIIFVWIEHMKVNSFPFPFSIL
jgi:hypothetical protein